MSSEDHFTLLFPFRRQRICPGVKHFARTLSTSFLTSSRFTLGGDGRLTLDTTHRGPLIFSKLYFFSFSAAKVTAFFFSNNLILFLRISISLSLLSTIGSVVVDWSSFLFFGDNVVRVFIARFLTFLASCLTSRVETCRTSQNVNISTKYSITHSPYLNSRKY